MVCAPPGKQVADLVCVRASIGRADREELLVSRETSVGSPLAGWLVGLQSNASRRLPEGHRSKLHQQEHQQERAIGWLWPDWKPMKHLRGRNKRGGKERDKSRVGAGRGGINRQPMADPWSVSICWSRARATKFHGLSLRTTCQGRQTSFSIFGLMLTNKEEEEEEATLTNPTPEEDFKREEEEATPTLE